MEVRSSGKGRSRDRIPTVSVRYVDGSTCDIPFACLREADFVESQPWRRARFAHGMLHHPGEYASATTGEQVVYESWLEPARLLLAGCDPTVVNIFARPCRVVARVDGRVCSHVPDFLLVMRSGTVRVVNVKPAERARDPAIAEVLAWPGRLVERHGWEYEVWTCVDPVLLESVRFLAGYRHPGIVPVGEIEGA